MPQVPHGLNLEGMGLVQDGAAICRARSLLGATLVLPAPLPGLPEGNAPTLFGFEAVCSRSCLYSSMVEGYTVSNTMVQWS